jgi:hypothetical protein
MDWSDEASAWSACMDFSVWEEVGMGQVAHQPTSDGPCYTCHHSGIGGNFLDADSMTTFGAVRQLPYLASYAVASWDEDGCFIEVIRSPLLLEKPDRLEGSAHPTFEWTDGRDQSIIDYFDRTQSRYLVGCEPSFVSRSE